MSSTRLPTTTTQQAYPWRAVLRTVVQVLLAAPIILTVLALVLATIAQDPFAEFLPGSAVVWLLGASAFLAGLSGVIARVMAIPQVDRWLARLRLGSAPYVARYRAADPPE